VGVEVPIRDPANDPLAQVQLPARDVRDLAVRFLKVSPAAAQATPNRGFEQQQVGTEEKFWISNWNTKQYESVNAKLRLVTQHLYLYVANGVDISQGDLQKAADSFEQDTYPKARRMAGDAHPHLRRRRPRDTCTRRSRSGRLLLVRRRVPPSVPAYSNERTMIYFNTDSIRRRCPGTTRCSRTSSPTCSTGTSTVRTGLGAGGARRLVPA